MRKIGSLLLDVALVGMATILAMLLRENFEAPPERLIEIAPYLLYSLAMAVVVLPLFGASHSVWRFSSIGDYLRIVAATLFIVGGAVLLAFSQNRLEGIARSMPVLQGLLVVFLLVGARVLVRFKHRMRQRPIQFAAASPGYAGETVLVVGMTRLTELYLRSVAEFAPDRFQIAGVLGRHDRQTGLHVHQLKILGTPEDLPEVLRQLEVHGIFVSRIVVAAEFGKLSEVARQALLDIEKATTIRIDLLTESLGLDGSNKPQSGSRDQGSQAIADSLTFKISDPASLPLQRRLFWGAKRVGDTLAAAVLIVLVFPVIVAVGLLVALDVGTPVVFWQQRPGRGGRPFHLYKFRTMAAAHDSSGQRRADSERVSSIGKFLRRSRLDELPQLYNIMVGEMSFVGPRPLLPVDQPASFAARLQVRPGLTGWAQIKGGREISASDKAALDVWYVQNATLRRELEIIAGTVSMVLFGERVHAPAIRQAWADLQAAGIYQPARTAVIAESVLAQPA